MNEIKLWAQCVFWDICHIWVTLWHLPILEKMIGLCIAHQWHKTPAKRKKWWDMKLKLHFPDFQHLFHRHSKKIHKANKMKCPSKTRTQILGFSKNETIWLILCRENWRNSRNICLKKEPFFPRLWGYLVPLTIYFKIFA